MPKTNLIFTARNIIRRNGQAKFGAEPGRSTTYLEVPDGEVPHPVDHKISKANWIKRVLKCAKSGEVPMEPKQPFGGYSFGDILVFVHGYNQSTSEVMHRHDLLQERLGEQGFAGVIVSFDWPSDSSALNYREDKRDAKASAQRLVDDGISMLATNQLQQDRRKCAINVHLLGHSMGAYVIQEAFADADERRKIAIINWRVSQVALIAADIDQDSLAENDPRSKALFSHAVRITNYSNRHDKILTLAKKKDPGNDPRAGRVGLPEKPPKNIVNVNVERYWDSLEENSNRSRGHWEHSWHFDDVTFARDLMYTLSGEPDRHVIPTRKEENGELWLVATG